MFLYPETALQEEKLRNEESKQKIDRIISERKKEEAAERILDMINPENSHPLHLSPEDFFR